MLFLISSLAALVAAKLTVHVVPHTHDDTGWLKTVDQYSTGSNDSIQDACTSCIISSVVTALSQNPERKFTYVEQAFFQRWWREQDTATQTLTQNLVKSGQLQFVNGAWCMHDEAATHYVDMIDQTTLGHRFLMDEFNYVPTVGWQIDPFGHSSTQAALLSAEMGFKGLFFGRIDYQDLGLRRKNKECEFVWSASESLGDTSKVFSGLTGEYGGNYGPPNGLDWNNNDEPVVDDPRMFSYNVKSRVDDFVKAAMSTANMTRGEHIMFTMGSDFQYRDAQKWFRSLDKIIKHVNADGRIEAKYSTPNEYLDAKLQEAQDSKISYPVKTDDFFPYADGADHFWTGYFVSRPALKGYVRDMSGFMQTVKQIDALHDTTSGQNAAIAAFQEAQGVAQHHDGVSGTSKQHVAFDYAMRISIGSSRSAKVMANALDSITGLKGLDWCPLTNHSLCDATQGLANGGTVKFAVWNPNGHSRNELVQIPVDSADGYTLTDATHGAEVPHDVFASGRTTDNYAGRLKAVGSKFMLAFSAENIPPLGYQVYTLTKAQAVKVDRPMPETARRRAPKADMTLENDNIQIKVCASTGAICSLTNKASGVAIDIAQSWIWYNSSIGDLSGNPDGQKSGAYIFRPNSTTAFPVGKGLPGQAPTILNGKTYSEIRQSFSDWVTQRIILYKDANYVDIEYTVGPIPTADKYGKEVVTRFDTSIKNNGESYTDSNGREMIKRNYNFRPTWKLNQTSDVSGNYFPVDAAIFIKDANAQLTLLTDRAQGGSGSLKTNGRMEVMVHRRTLQDDGRGVGEPIDETQFISPYTQCPKVGCGAHYGPGLIIRGVHRLSLEKPSNAAAAWRPLADQMFGQVRLMYTSSTGDSGTPTIPSRSFMTAGKSLPPNLQILTIERWAKNTILLRIAHQFGVNEDADLSKPAEVDLSTLVDLNGKTFTAREVSLSGNQDIATLRKTQAWSIPTDGPAQGVHEWRGTSGLTGTTVTLGPLEIKTFFLDVQA